MNLYITLLCTLVSQEYKNTNFIIVNLQELQWYACSKEKIIRIGVANGGRKRCKEDSRLSCKTPIGTFSILKKYGKNKRSIKYPIECKNKKRCGAKMYYFMKFHRSGVGLHGSDEIKKHANLSHGCIRLEKKDAKWLNQNFLRLNDRIIVLNY